MAAVKCDHNVIIKTNFPHHLKIVITFNCSYVRHQKRCRKQQTELCLQKRKHFLLFCGAYGNNCLTLSYRFFFFLVLSCMTVCSREVTSCTNKRAAAAAERFLSSFYCKWRDDVIQSRSDMMVCCEYLHGSFQYWVQTLLLCR